jgi:hypothetical protein
VVTVMAKVVEHIWKDGSEPIRPFSDKKMFGSNGCILPTTEGHNAIPGTFDLGEAWIRKNLIEGDF